MLEAWSIYQGEVGDANVTERGPNYLYVCIYKAFREEYKQRLFVLNNTLLHPTNLTALGCGTFASSDDRGTLRAFADRRFEIVNQRLGLGPFYGPQAPRNRAPADGSSVLGDVLLAATPHAHSAPTPRPHFSTTWLIRAAGGTYHPPVFRTISTSDLSSIPIPRGRLTLGDTYFWRCVYTDADRHPSVESPETSFVLGTPP